MAYSHILAVKSEQKSLLIQPVLVCWGAGEGFEGLTNKPIDLHPTEEILVY